MKPLVVVAIVAILAIPVVVIYELNGHSLDLTDRQAILVITDSMDGDEHGYAIGSFPANTLVMVQHLSDLDKRFLRAGDVVSYESHGKLEHHRIIESNAGYYYVQGDNNHSIERVNLDQINGKVIGSSPWLGKVIILIKDNFLAFLGAMSVLCFVLILLAAYNRDNKTEVVG